MLTVLLTFTWHSGHSDLLHLAKKQQGCLVRYFKLDYTYLVQRMIRLDVSNDKKHDYVMGGKKRKVKSIKV